jgi:CDP-glucose 4,6-dehydratase
LLRQGAIVTGYDILDGLDVCDYDRLEYIASSSGAEIIYHLAAQSQVLVANDYPRHAIDTNIRGTLNVLNVARNLKTVQKTVIASTDKVYGEVGAVRDAVNESGAFLAKNPYDVSKACADMLANMYIDLYGMNVSISRSCNIYGYGDNNYTRLILKPFRLCWLAKRRSSTVTANRRVNLCISMIALMDMYDLVTRR